MSECFILEINSPFLKYSYKGNYSTKRKSSMHANSFHVFTVQHRSPSKRNLYQPPDLYPRLPDKTNLAQHSKGLPCERKMQWRILWKGNVGWCLSTISQSFKQLKILLENTNGFHCCLEQNPTESKDSYCQTDLPWPCRLRAPPNQW